jgi:lipoprotein-releasing system permease protein
MLFELKVAARYLVSARLQSALLMFGVSVGVIVFTFMAALMNGLNVRLTKDITGNVAHVTLEPERRVPRAFMASPTGRALFAVQPGHNDRPVIRNYRSVLAVASGMEGVRAVVPEVFGNATLARGERNVAVSVTGVEADDADEIAPLGESMVRGRLDLGVGNIVVGSRLATELGVDAGDRVKLGAAGSPDARADAAAAEAVLVVRGIFTLGVQAIDERVVYIDLDSARKFFNVVEGVSLVELKVDDVWQAPVLAARLGRATRLKASSWLERNTRLQEGLRAQASTSNMIKAFSLLTIAIGVASALFLSVRTSKLSGGQKQRVAVARALVMKPELVLADEPTGNLDRKTSDEVMILLREFSREEGTAFLISTHDESIAQRCDRILTMEDGMLSGPAQTERQGACSASARDCANASSATPSV